MRKPFFTKIDDAPREGMRLGRGQMIRLVWPQVGADNVDLHINLINPDSGPGPLHYHERSENVYVVLEGEVEVVIEGERHLFGPGDVAFIPPGLRHTAGNSGKDNKVAKVIEIYAPPGPDFHIVDRSSTGDPVQD